MRLVVTVPEDWPDATSPVIWALVRPDRSLASEGVAPIAGLPAARRTTLVIPASRVLLTVATLPRRKARRVQQALAFAVEDQLTSDPEAVHAVAASTPRGNRQPVAIVEREWLHGLLATLRAGGVFPDSATVETCLGPIADREWKLVLRGDGGFLRTGAAAGVGFDGAFDRAVPDVLRLALEAARSAGETPRCISVHAGSELDLSRWAHELGVPCSPAGPWQAWRFAEWPAVEFLQGEFKRSGVASTLWPRLRPAAALAAAALVVEVAATLSQWGALRYEKAQLEARMREQFKSAFPQAQVVDPALQMRRNLQAARAAAGQMQEGDFLPLLARATLLESEGSRITAIGYDAGKLTLDVLLADRKLVDSMLKRLDGQDVRVALEAANPKAGEARFVVAGRGSR